jgi:hypothetical protein
MRFGQPDVQRYDACLGSEAGEREHERDARPARGGLQLAHGVEAVVAGSRLQRAEAQQDRDRSDMGDEDVQVASAPDLGVPMIARHQKERR